jgi:hypothetical protein
MDDKPDFAFGKKIAICESIDTFENRIIIFHVLERLFQCMKETNELHKVNSEYFRLDFRPQNLFEDLSQEFSRDMLVLDLKWGSKKELEKVKKSNNNIDAKDGE